MSEQESQVLFIVFGGIFLGLIMTFFVSAMVLFHRQRQLQNRQRLDQVKEEFEKTLLNVQNEIQQETLTHIGRELHDNIGQLLSLAKLYLSSSKPEQQTEGKKLIPEIISEVRTLSKTLNLDWVEQLTLSEYMQQQLQKIESTGFCKTRLTDSLQEAWEIEKGKKLVLIRVIQECLNNAIKHASPNQIAIDLEKKEGNIHICIQDDGTGFIQQEVQTGSGLTNLKNRMESIGGKFELSSHPGKGTKINLFLPSYG